MEIKEIIKFLEENNVGNHVKIEYKNPSIFSNKNKSIEGLIYSMNPNYIGIAEPGTNIFKDVTYTTISFSQIIRYTNQTKTSDDNNYSGDSN
jgi:hypothetical protein